jgi:hypothetical protein
MRLTQGAKMYSREHIKKAIDDGVIIGDGHSLVDPSHYVGFDVEKLTVTHKSDFSNGKSTIYTNGIPVEELVAVYNLDFLYNIVRQLGLNCDTSYFGRGSQAREYYSKLEEYANGSE